LHDDDRLVLDDLVLDDLLFVRFQGALVLGLLPHPLDGVHDVALVVEKCVAQLRRPLDVVGEPFHHVGNGRHRLDRRVPGLLGNRVGQGLVLEGRVLSEPLL